MAKFAIPLLIFLSLFTAQIAALGGKVGGRKPVKNVKSNKEVQDLGKYCVQQYNQQLQKANGSSAKLLEFSQVVEAETQVVSGIKYYLKIRAAHGGGAPMTFKAVVVVKPWLKSKKLLDFAPSAPPMNTK